MCSSLRPSGVTVVFKSAGLSYVRAGKLTVQRQARHVLLRVHEGMCLDVKDGQRAAVCQLLNNLSPLAHVKASSLIYIYWSLGLAGRDFAKLTSPCSGQNSG